MRSEIPNFFSIDAGYFLREPMMLNFTQIRFETMEPWAFFEESLATRTRRTRGTTRCVYTAYVCYDT